MPEAIISLGIEQTVFVKACTLELVIHIGSQYKIVLVLDQCQKFLIDRKWSIYIAVIENMAAPPCPVFFQGVKGVKSAGVYIGDSVSFMEIGEIGLKTLSAVSQTCRS